jgi:hypothetical protein
MFSKRLTRRRSIVAIVMSVGLGLGSGSANAGEGYCEEVDLTGCGCVDAMTVFILLSSWGEARDGFADFNGDGIVGGFDLAYVIAHMSHVFEPSDCLPIPREPAPLDVLVNDETDAETEGAGLREFAIYAPFTDPNAQPISVYGATFTLTGAKEWLQTDSYSERDS